MPPKRLRQAHNVHAARAAHVDPHPPAASSQKLDNRLAAAAELAGSKLDEPCAFGKRAAGGRPVALVAGGAPQGTGPRVRKSGEPPRAPRPRLRLIDREPRAPTRRAEGKQARAVARNRSKHRDRGEAGGPALLPEMGVRDMAKFPRIPTPQPRPRSGKSA